MDRREILRTALQALAVNKMRTVLTMLGIIIGVAAVICTVAIGEGASQQVQEQIRSMGENMIFINAGNVNRGGVNFGAQATKTLTAEDADAIRRQIPLIALVSPGVNTGAQVVYAGQNWFTEVVGVSPEYFQIRHWDIARGSIFSQRDVDTAANVCVIGRTVALNLFGTDDPVGKMIRIKQLPFLVIGELAPKGLATWGRDQDDTIIAPYTTVQKKLVGISWVQYINASAISDEAIQPAIQQIALLLRQRHKLRPNEDDDFIIRSPQELADARMESARIMSVLLAAIASVSLVVGGIGIMNIMLVSVTERRREIGVRRAVGARRSDIRWQFLSEALLLSMIGGAVGVVGGLIGSLAVSGMLRWPTLIPPESIAIAVGFSAAVGIFFGYYPAQKAAQLDPIETLRYE
jgi:putative ABC transport system permease protein